MCVGVSYLIFRSSLLLIISKVPFGVPTILGAVVVPGEDGLELLLFLLLLLFLFPFFFFSSAVFVLVFDVLVVVVVVLELLVIEVLDDHCSRPPRWLLSAIRRSSVATLAIWSRRRWLKQKRRPPLSSVSHRLPPSRVRLRRAITSA